MIKRLIQGVLILFISNIFYLIAQADDYRLDAEPQYTTGTAHTVMDFETPSDPEACQIYLRNLRYYARLNTPMSCERPIAPQYKANIQLVEWENLNPTEYPKLFAAIVTKVSYGSDNTKEAIDYRAKEVLKGISVFRRAKLELTSTFFNDETQKLNNKAETFHIVQYGPNVIDPKNPEPVWRCKSRRGGGPENDQFALHLYIASADLKHLKSDLVDYMQNGITGEHLRIINDRPYVESVAKNGYITLMQIRTEWPIGLDSVCGFEFLRSSKQQVRKKP